MRITKMFSIVAISMFLFAAADVFAYTWAKCGDTNTNVKWAGKAVSLRASGVGFPANSVWRSALSSVATRWNYGPSQFSYNMSYDEPGVALNNGQSEVWWVTSLSAPAMASYWYVDCEIVEADIRFRNTDPYSTATNKSWLTPYGGSSRPFQTTAMHEFGHAQGLGHTTDTYSIMGQDWDHIHSNGATANAYPGEDAMAGSVAQYGNQSGHEDLGVSHWRYTGSSGGYSTHARTRIFNNSNVELAKVSGTSEPIYKVSKGQTVKLELTYENMGTTSPKTITIYYYVSTNDYISTGDTYIGFGTITVYRDKPTTTSNTSLVIPNNLTTGNTYYLGAVIDPHDAVSENYESNNASYIGIRIL